MVMTKEEKLEKAKIKRQEVYRNKKAFKERQLQLPLECSDSTTTNDTTKSMPYIQPINKTAENTLKMSLWRDAMTAQMHNGRLLHPAQLNEASKFADAYSKMAMEKFN